MKLIERLPDYYSGSTPDAELQEAFQYWTDRLRHERDDLISQLNVQSATWGINAWEAALGIKTDISKPYTYRRSRIEGKLRGLGVATRAMLKNVASSFSAGEIELIEYSEEFRFVIRFEGIYSIPVNLQDLIAAIREIRPAHLVFSFRSVSVLPEAQVTIGTAISTPVYYHRLDSDIDYTVRAAELPVNALAAISGQHRSGSLNYDVHYTGSKSETEVKARFGTVLSYRRTIIGGD